MNNINLNALFLFCRNLEVTIGSVNVFFYNSASWLIDWQLIVGWGTDSSSTEVLDFTRIPYTIIVSYSHLNYPGLNFGNGISDLIIL